MPKPLYGGKFRCGKLVVGARNNIETAVVNGENKHIT